MAYISCCFGYARIVVAIKQDFRCSLHSIISYRDNYADVLAFPCPFFLSLSLSILYNSKWKHLTIRNMNYNEELYKLVADYYECLHFFSPFRPYKYIN